MDITQQQLVYLRYMCIGVIIVFVINVIALLHNLYRYIYKQKLYAPLILLFYLFVFLSFIFRIAELATITVVIEFFPIHPVASVTAAIATSFMIYVGLNLILSMK